MRRLKKKREKKFNAFDDFCLFAKKFIIMHTFVKIHNITWCRSRQKLSNVYNWWIENHSLFMIRWISLKHRNVQKICDEKLFKTLINSFEVSRIDVMIKKHEWFDHDDFEWKQLRFCFVFQFYVIEKRFKKQLRWKIVDFLM